MRHSQIQCHTDSRGRQAWIRIMASWREVDPGGWTQGGRFDSGFICRQWIYERGTPLLGSICLHLTVQSWMPVVRRLVSSSDRENGKFGDSDSALPSILTSTRIDEIWFLDDYHHGQSMDLNKGLIGPVHSWLDGGRDIANFIKHILPSTNRSNISETLSWDGDSQPSTARKVIGLGHSVGGNAMCVYSRYDETDKKGTSSPIVPRTLSRTLPC